MVYLWPAGITVTVEPSDAEILVDVRAVLV